MVEFDLSEKICCYGGDHLHLTDVRELIREIIKKGESSYKPRGKREREISKWIVIHIDDLNKLAGDKLT